MLKTSILGAAMLAGLLTLPAAAQVQIGVAGPLTGSNAAAGDQMKTGATQAVADLNKAGGVLGKQVQLTVADDACDPKQAVSVANQMVEKKVVLVAGHYCSGSSIPASKVYLEEGILEISPASTPFAESAQGTEPTGGKNRLVTFGEEFVPHIIGHCRPPALVDLPTCNPRAISLGRNGPAASRRLPEL